MKVCRLCLVAAMAFLLFSCGKSDGGNNVIDSSLPADFATMSDSAKVRVLLDHGLSPDSIAVFVCETAEGKHPGIAFKDFTVVDTYMYERLGETGFGLYRQAFDSYMEYMPLVAKMKMLMASPLADLDRVGYELGLGHVNQVIEKRLTIGKVDREVAELRRACGNDEDTFNRFLRGFAAGINTRAAGEIPAEIVAEYGTPGPARTAPRYKEAAHSDAQPVDADVSTVVEEEVPVVEDTPITLAD